MPFFLRIYKKKFNFFSLGAFRDLSFKILEKLKKIFPEFSPYKLSERSAKITGSVQLHYHHDCTVPVPAQCGLLGVSLFPY